MSIETNLTVRRVYSLPEKKKKLLFTKIIDVKDNIFNVAYLKKILPNINTLEEIQLNKLLKMKKDSCKKCLFFENNFCWISLNRNGKQRYFTKGYITYGLDIYDLLSIYFNCTYNKMLKMVTALGFNFKNIEVSEIIKHDKNKADILTIIESKPNISNILKEKIDIYLALNDFGMKNILTFNRCNSKSMFFVSIRYLKQKYNLPYSISTISKIINCYSNIGIINKISEDEIDNPIYRNYKMKFKKDKKAPISFYSIPPINVVIDKADEKINTINNTDLNVNTLPKECKNNKKKIISNTFNKTIEQYFNEYLEKYNVVAKEWIKKHQEINLSDSTFNKKWRGLVGENKGKSIKPNNNLRKKYNLISNQEIFIKTA